MAFVKIAACNNITLSLSFSLQMDPSWQRVLPFVSQSVDTLALKQQQAMLIVMYLLQDNDLLCHQPILNKHKQTMLEKPNESQ